MSLFWCEFSLAVETTRKANCHVRNCSVRGNALNRSLSELPHWNAGELMQTVSPNEKSTNSANDYGSNGGCLGRKKGPAMLKTLMGYSPGPLGRCFLKCRFCSLLMW